MRLILDGGARPLVTFRFVSSLALVATAMAGCSSSAGEAADASAGASQGGADAGASRGGRGGAQTSTGGTRGGNGPDKPKPMEMTDPNGGSGSFAGTGGVGEDPEQPECRKDADCIERAPSTSPAGCAVAQCRNSACVYVAKDGDDDGEPSANCKAAGGAEIQIGEDCDDTDETVKPEAAEACDGKDNDCNGAVDDAVPISTMGCTVGVGACVANGVLSCADGSYSKCEATPKSPSNDAECDNIDHNCDGQVNKSGCVCTPGQGVVQARTCAAPITVTCTANGQIPGFDAGPGKEAYCLDDDNDGYRSGTCGDYCAGSQPAEYISASAAGDCNDGNGSSHPGLDETCDGVDNNCDGTVDNTLKYCHGYYVGCGSVCPPGYSPDPYDGGACLEDVESQVVNIEPKIGWDATPGFPSGCGIGTDKDYYANCGEGMVKSSQWVGWIAGKGHCEGIWLSDDPNDCSLRIHYGTSWCDAFTCRIDVKARRKMPRC